MLDLVDPPIGVGGCPVSSEVRNPVARPRSNNEGQAAGPIGNRARALPTTET